MIAQLSIQSPEGPFLIHLEFAKAGDDSGLKNWKKPPRHSRPDLARDAIELARLAGKRWRYYLRRNEAATSLEDLLMKVGENPRSEVGFILQARAADESNGPSLGVAWCRRTWCNHLVLDFLTVHPALNDPQSGYKGMGSAMFMAIAIVAERMGCQLVWGEATETSCTFYQKLLGGTPVMDHFFFGSEALAGLREQHASSQTAKHAKP